MARFLIVALMAGSALTAAASESIEALYARLDSLISVQDDITAAKRNHIAAIIDAATGGEPLSADERYRLNERLYKEYIAFNYDSAFRYASLNVELARATGDYSRQCDSRIKLAHITSVAGLFDKAGELLDSIDHRRLDASLQAEYYNERSKVFQYRREFAQGTPFEREYADSAQHYRALTMSLATPDSFRHVFSQAVHTAEQGDADGAVSALLPWLDHYGAGTRNYAIVASTLAYFHSLRGDEQSRERYLLLSAISDVQGAVRENTSLRALSMLLLDKGDVDRAFNYLNTSINDAVFYGSRLRNIQSGQLAPIIIKAYNDNRSAQHRQTQLQLLVMAILAVIMAIVLAVIVWLMKKRRDANARIALVNSRLQDTVDELQRVNVLIKQSNQIKDEYIVRFMMLSSTMIERAERQRKDNLKLARDRKLDQLYSNLKSTAQDSDNVKLFHENFDTAFLNIFPQFVEQVNKLWRPEDRITPSHGLTTELRILALIRLGITDNATISGILRSSLSTVYTYRSRLKARALEPDTFDATVKSLGEITR